MDRAGTTAHRQRLLAGLTGVVIEVGAGNGLNFAHYPAQVTHVLAVEPEPRLRDLARKAAAAAPVRVEVVDGLAEQLPASSASFDGAVACLMLCSVPSQQTALAEMHRVLRPGGRLLVLEFSKPENPLVAAAYGAFQSLWPLVGRAVTGDAAAYRYLVESIEVHPNQKALRLMITDAGFANVGYENLLNGIVAIHHADKIARS
jgi:ubiquinone/menaquinone biosynthesis methyltransferase